MNIESSNFMEIVLVPMCGGGNPDFLQPQHELQPVVSKDQNEMYELQHILGGLMMPLDEQHNIEMLKEKFHVQEMPTLVIMDKFGMEVSRDGIHDIKKYSKQQLLTKWSENFKKD